MFTKRYIVTEYNAHAYGKHNPEEKHDSYSFGVGVNVHELYYGDDYYTACAYYGEAADKNRNFWELEKSEGSAPSIKYKEVELERVTLKDGFYMKGHTLSSECSIPEELRKWMENPNYYEVIEYDSYASEQDGWYHYFEDNNENSYFKADSTLTEARELFDSLVEDYRGYFKIRKVSEKGLESVDYKTFELYWYVPDFECPGEFSTMELLDSSCSLPVDVKQAMGRAERGLRDYLSGKKESYENLHSILGLDNSEN